MPKVNANTAQHTIFIWGGDRSQITKADQRWLNGMNDDRRWSINGLIRVVRKLHGMDAPGFKVDISIDTDGLIFTQWNDGIEMSITDSGNLESMWRDLLLLRKWFNAPRPEVI